MNKFPYIGENKHGVTMLILSRSKGVILSDVNKGKTHTIPDSKANPSTWFERKYKNITADYLTNTKVKIESEEHEIFVRELSSSANLKCAVLNEFAFIFDDFIEDANKLITIPLPPKESEAKITTESVVTGDSKTYDVTPLSEWQGGEVKFRKVGYVEKEWPAVGDEVLINDLKCNVIGIDGDAYWIKRKKTGTYDIAKREQLKKPLTPKDDLDRKLYDFFQCNSEEDLAEAIISGEIEGLEYKPQYKFKD